MPDYTTKSKKKKTVVLYFSLISSDVIICHLVLHFCKLLKPPTFNLHSVSPLLPQGKWRLFKLKERAGEKYSLSSRDVCGAAVLPHSLSLCICMALGDAHIKGYGAVIHQDYKGLQFQIKALQRSDIQPRASWSGIPADAFSFSPPSKPTDLLVMALCPLSMCAHSNHSCGI